MKKNTAIILLFAAALNGCLSSDPTINEDFGASVRHNIAVQTAYPDATGPDDSEIQEGQQAEDALQRYRERDTQETDSESLIQNVGGN